MPPMVSVSFLQSLSLQALTPIETENPRTASVAAKLSSPFICLLTDSPYLTRGGLTSVGRQRWGSATHCSFIRAKKTTTGT